MSLTCNFGDVYDKMVLSLTSPKLHVKLITYMNNEKSVVFSISPQLRGLGPKSQDLVISFHLG